MMRLLRGTIKMCNKKTPAFGRGRERVETSAFLFGGEKYSNRIQIPGRTNPVSFI